MSRRGIIQQCAERLALETLGHGSVGKGSFNKRWVQIDIPGYRYGCRRDYEDVHVRECVLMNRTQDMSPNGSSEEGSVQLIYERCETRLLADTSDQ